MNETLATQIHALPCFAGVADIAELAGGMTNRNDLAPDAAWVRAFLAMRCALALRETLWALVSQQDSTIAVDDRTLARDWCARLDICRQAFESGRRLS